MELKECNALWQSVSVQLNSLGYGEKTVDGWRKVSKYVIIPSQTFINLEISYKLSGKSNITNLYLFSDAYWFTDWKCKTKSKASAIKMEQQRTGGGPPQVPPLTTLEKRILKIMGNKAIYGDEIVPELGFGKVSATLC